MFSLFTNKNKQIIKAIERRLFDKTYRVAYKPKDIDNAKEWYIANTPNPNLAFIQQMMEVKHQLEMENIAQQA